MYVLFVHPVVCCPLLRKKWIYVITKLSVSFHDYQKKMADFNENCVKFIPSILPQ